MEKKITALFEINVPKTAKTLAKFVSKDTIRPQFCGVCIDPDKGYMAATDTTKLRLINIETTGEWPEDLRVLVEPSHISKIAGNTVMVTVYEFGSQRVTEIECNGETYTTQTGVLNIPDFMRVVPAKENRRAIYLTPDSLNALKTICKLHKGSNCIALDMEEGSDILMVYDEIIDRYDEHRAAYALRLAAPAELSATISQDPKRLMDCLNGSDGVITFRDHDAEHTPVMYNGEADATILMPMLGNEATAEYINDNRRHLTTAETSFSDDATATLSQLQEAAAELWKSIINFHTKEGECCLIPGNYSAKEIANRNKAKCGYYVFPDYAIYVDPLTISCGKISITIGYECLFELLTEWETANRCKKSVFAVGEVEEITETVYHATVEGVSEEKKKLRRIDGNWYCDAKRTAKSYDTAIYCRVNEKLVYIRNLAWSTIDDKYYWRQFADGKEEQIPGLVLSCAKNRDEWREMANILGLTEGTAAAPQPTETPQISTKTAKVVNESAEGESPLKTYQREPKTAKCRLVPRWMAKTVLKNGATPLCFNLCEDGSFSITVELNGDVAPLTKEQFRELWPDKSPRPLETPPAKDLSTGPEEAAQTANKRRNPTIKKFLHVRKFRITEDLSFLRHWESGCRVGRVLSEASTVFHGECSTRFVPQIFSGCTTALPP